ncbi:amino acid adenylation domain-containing protein [Neorhodopirellula lusitana]|uniref:amino acid adenylation domain-containing protein n=1 Tax=Neorhodopirellula lusitana TaxID=445327 RepID=UPI00384B000F
MSDIERRLAQLSPAKRALLEKMILERGGSLTAEIPVRPMDAPAELSGAEKRLWFVDQIAKDDPFYNMPLAARLRGPLKQEAFERAIDTVVERHESLRTTYHLSDGSPYRQVHPSMSVQCSWVDLSASTDAESELKGRMRVAGRAPFDLENGPLLRVTVYRLGEDHHVVLLVMHHIVSDGWSMIVMLRELTLAYEAFVIGENPELSPLTIQYADFTHWQNERLSGDRIDSQMQYWRDQLVDAPAVLDLPVDHPRPAIQDFVGATVEFELSPKLTSGINELAITLRTTPFVILMAAEAVLMSRSCRQEELVLGTASAGRVHPEIEPLIGFFVNTLPLRIDLRESPTFVELVQQIHNTTLQAHENAEVPFERLVEEFAPTRDRSFSPIFQAALVMQNLPRDHKLARDLGREASLQVDPILIDNGTAKYDLTFFLWEENDRLIGHVEYRSTLLDRSTIERMIASYQSILDAAVGSPDLKVESLPILSSDQFDQVVHAFNDTAVVETGTSLLHELVEQRATLRPSKIAVDDAGKEFSFERLIERAHQIAQHLLVAGIQSESAVVLRLPRSFDLVAAVLGVLKAGGSFVPTNMDTPQARIDQVVEDVDAFAIIDSDWLEAHPDAPDHEVGFPEVKPTDRAYVIFTSGSTGKPKGVQIEHRTIANFIRGQIERMEVGDEDRFLFIFSPAFDGAVSEIFYSLSSGGTCVPVDQATLLDPATLTQFLNDSKITVAKFPPALLSMLNPGDLPNVKIVASAGDKLTGELARRWTSAGRCVFNGYGPTEVSVGCSMMPLHQNWNSDKPPIGRPMRNMRMYVLDSQLQPLPIGVTGEIYVGGGGVSRGYLNAPELTDAVFLDDPFASPAYPDLDQAKMYRTGDLGRWLPSGEMEFVGRADDQVSVRGYRIEPGEIAAVMETLPAVRQATVVQRTDDATSQLVAYAVAEPEAFDGDWISASEVDHVTQWHSLFEQTHRLAPPVLDTSFNVTGWISTFTGQPIPTGEMRQWADGAVSRIVALHADRVLEIGCGTGLLLLRVAEHCQSYVGADLLASSLENIRSELKHKPELSSRVTLHQSNADDFSYLGADAENPESFDCLVLNSVVQYFPSLAYLQRVLHDAIEFIEPGGYLFLGDIRNLLLQEAMATAVEQARAESDLTVSELKHRVASRIEHEEELLIDPRWFQQLTAIHPRLREARILLKAADAENELSQFRFDVVMRVDEPVSSEVLEQVHASQYETTLAVERAEAEMLAWHCLQSMSDQETLADLEAAVVSDEQGKPDWGNLATVDRFANDPAAAEVSRRFTQHLRDELLERLPGYMVPSAFVLMDELPRTTNGKIDRDALPRPSGRPAWAGDFEAASTPTQQILVEIWEELLDAHPIGVRDDFFELGGHSMLAVRMTSEVEKKLGERLPLVALFQNATIAHLAELIDQPDLASISSTLVPLSASAGRASKTSKAAPLFCVHPAGGTVFCYRELAHFLAAHDEVDGRAIYGLQANGIDGNRPPHETLAEMAAHYARVISEQQPSGKVHLAGWSLGGNIAFEVARQLRIRGRSVGIVALLDSGLLSPETEFREEDFLPLLSALFPGAANLDLEAIRQKPAAEQLQFFVDRAAQAGIVPEELDAENLAANNAMHVFGVFQANVKAVHEYVAEPYAGEVHLFRPDDQDRTNPLFDDPLLGWRAVTEGVQVVTVPGDHAHMLQEPAVSALAEQLAGMLNRDDASS